MRGCDHKAIQDLSVAEFVPPDQQKVDYNIPPYRWFTGCSYNGPTVKIPANKALPFMDTSSTGVRERTAGENEIEKAERTRLTIAAIWRGRHML